VAGQSSYRGEARLARDVHDLDDNDHLLLGLVRVHYPVSLADVFELKYPRRFRLVPAGRHVACNHLQRNVRQRESRRPEHEAAKERKVDAARHLQERVEVCNGRRPDAQGTEGLQT
jgi:hypothetical protein